jgi:hypothetical protein
VNMHLCHVTCEAGWSLAALTVLSHIDDYECVDYDGHHALSAPRVIIPAASVLTSSFVGVFCQGPIGENPKPIAAIYHVTGSKNVELRLRSETPLTARDKIRRVLAGVDVGIRVFRVHEDT